jgi:predicted acylesterase/phospholipase RssA
MATAGLAVYILAAGAVPGESQEAAPARPAGEASALRAAYRQDDAGLVREVRLALVCYGGSSLAIYIHGNSKELHRLVQASKALEIDAKAPDHALRDAVLRGDKPQPGAGGLKLSGSTRQWYERLLELWETDPQKVRTRVLIDVIAGTSAGGINGVILAKALAHDLSEDELTRLWFDKASLSRLTNRYFGLLRVLTGRAPVDGDALLGWLFDALSIMDKAYAGHSLLPTGDRLDLFVTATDRYGYPQNLVVGDPATAAEPHNRQVLHFSYPGLKKGCGPDAKDDHFCPYWTPALAFAARASSSIPGVFPPLGLAHALETIGTTGGKAQPATLQHDIVSKFFRNYQLQRANGDDTYVEKTFFVDGGVLDNHPFGPAIEEILRRSQDQEVRRYLLYLQPDPGRPPALPSGKYPGLLSTIWAGLSGITGGQPILDNLEDIADHNSRLERLRDIVRAEEKAAQAAERGGGGSGDCADAARLPVAERFGCVVGVPPSQLDAAMAKASQEDLRVLRRKLEAIAAQGSSELADRTYISVRVHSVLDQFVEVISAESACNYPPESAHRALVEEIIGRWAETRHLTGTPDDPGGDLQEQLKFLEDFDVGYLRRQLRFVIDWINTQYEASGDRPLPDARRRAQLDAVKAAASREVEVLTSFIGGTAGDPALTGPLGRTLDLFRDLRPWSGEGQLALPLDQQAAAFVGDAQKLAALDAVRSELGGALRLLQEQIRRDSFERFKELTAGWPATDRRELLVRYMGFPFWDRQIYPLLAFSDIGEFEKIQVYRLSPNDANLLGGGPAATRLVGAKAAHFGAFLSRPGREADYVWGRLDAAERLLKLLGLTNAGAKPLFTSILDEEQKAGLVRGSILEARRKQVAALPN